MMNREKLLSSALQWMSHRGWRTKLAKRRGYEQSLLEHTLIELDALLAILPILASPQHYGFTEREQQILLAAVLSHDVGKETDAWQAYVRDPQPSRRLPHVIPELTHAVVPELCSVFGFEDLGEQVQRVMAHCADFHHNRPARSDGAIFEAILSAGSDRFLSLAYVVQAIDRVCSASTSADAQDAVHRNPALADHLRTARHEVVMRGVSSTFLHRASQLAFQQHGWVPLLYYAAETLYVADPSVHPAEPTLEEISEHLRNEINGALARDTARLMVGSPTGNILPKPDLFSFSEAKQYLEHAARTISPLSFSKKSLREKRKVVEAYWKALGTRDRPTDDQVDYDSGRISRAQPEMLVFKFFKAMVDPQKISAVGPDGAARAAKMYEEAFGAGTWAALQSTSTLMPAKDMVNTVEYYWRLSGSTVSHPEVRTVAELPDEERLRILIGILGDIAETVYASSRSGSPRDKLAQAMADTFLLDLSAPAEANGARLLAQRQLTHYVQSKPYAGRPVAKGIYLCPVCSRPFDSDTGVKASADFVDNPQAHTNRGVAYGSFGYIMICTGCYHERLLRQILLGQRPAEMISLAPHLGMGPAKGELLILKVQEWIQAATARLRGDAGNLELGFSLSFIDQAANRLNGSDPCSLRPGDLLSLFSFPFTPETQKKRRREALKRLKEEFDDDLAVFSAACGQPFQTWEAAVDALVEGKIDQQDALVIRREVFRLHETLHVVCQTPNVIVIPLTYQIAGVNDESEASRALRRLYVSLVLGFAFDASVAIHQESEPVDFQGGTGTAYVPPVPAIRSLIRYEWLPSTAAWKWLAAIGAASLLVRDTGLPPRNALYQILAADPAESLVRRIETGGGRILTLRQLRLIERLPRFQSTRIIQGLP